MKFRCAGIVLFNPDLNRLNENYDSICNQVDNVILVDNNSENINEIRQMFLDKKDVLIIENDKNLGIATALNQIAEYAIKLGFDWVYLLDQDSISSPTIINSYNKYIENDSVALLTPYIVDINKISLEDFKLLSLPETSEVNWAITSGSLINLKTWREVGQFTDELFIDAVDFDYSIRLNIKGYQQLRINSEYLLQEVGNAEPTKIFRPHKDNSGKWTWKRYYRSNHSAVRQYYMVRNHIILARKYQRNRSIYKGIIFVIVFTIPKLIVEKNRFRLLKQILKGVADGYKFQIEKY